MPLADIGLVGLAVMGQNLVLNFDDHGYRVAVFNRTPGKVDEFMAGAANGTNVMATHTLEEMVSKLESPRVVMLMVKAGAVVDQLIEELIPLLAPGDIIIDGGNSLFTDTNRRTRHLAQHELAYIGTGVSGGELGARHGPSIMPGGDKRAWPRVKPMLQAVAAKVGDEPCCAWVGPEGAGHYVKMVHNGIEYGDMQLICEAYQLMHQGLGLDADRLHQVFTEWNQGVLDSYLIQITATILGYRDPQGEPLVDKILDTAGQKGTGRWTGINALELGVPLTLVTEAVFARCLSALKPQRQRAAEQLGTQRPDFDGDTERALGHVHDALYASKIISYAQGFMLMREAAGEYGWSLELGDIAALWRGGCIIRSRFLDDIKRAFQTQPTLENLLLDPFFATEIARTESGWRETVKLAVDLNIPTPAFSSALAFFDGYRSAELPANLLQAQRDLFGAHTYERVDAPRGEFFHTDWTGEGGKAASTGYNA